MSSIRVLIAEDHSIVRDGLRLLLESQPDFAVVAEAANGREAVIRAKEARISGSVRMRMKSFSVKGSSSTRIGKRP